MSRIGTDLPGLQNLIKRDPQVYREEFLQQVYIVYFGFIISMLTSKLN